MTKIYNCEGNGEVHLDVLKAICGDTDGKSMLDLCCGEAPQTRKLNYSRRTYVDIVYRDLQKDKNYFINEDICEYIKRRLYSNCTYDCLIILDGLEHFKKEKGHWILRAIDLLSRLKIVFVPLGDYLIEKTETDNPDSHKSGWLPKEFEDMGWHTIVFHNFHPTLNIGAFFAIKCDNLESEFERIINELNKKEWAK